MFWINYHKCINRALKYICALMGINIDMATEWLWTRRRREDNNERAMSGTPLMTISSRGSRGWMFDTAPPHRHPPTAHPPPPFTTTTINTYNRRPICDLKASITLPSLNR